MTHRFALALALVLAIAACGGVKTNPGDEPDAAPPVDAAPDAPPDAPMPVAHRYVIDRHTIPTSNGEAQNLALDLNGDATRDNQLGLVMATFNGQGIPSQPFATIAVDRGAILTLAELESIGFTTGAARFTLFTGSNPVPAPCNGGSDTICRRHLTGSGQFTVEPGSPHDPRLTGTLTGGTFESAIDGTARLHISIAMMTATPIALELIGARAKVIGASDGGITSGVIAGGITQTEIDTKLLPGWQQGINAQIAADCSGGAPPVCGCQTGSTGRSWLQLLDLAPADCTVSIAEIETNTLIQALFVPDVMLDGQQALSLGIGFTAVKATYTP